MQDRKQLSAISRQLSVINGEFLNASSPNFQITSRHGEPGKCQPTLQDNVWTAHF